MRSKVRILWLTICAVLMMCGMAQAEKLKLPENTTEIADYAFYQCAEFEGELILPVGVRRIGEHAFDGCTGLSGTVIIPEGVVVAETAFANTSLEIIDLNDFHYTVSNGKATLTAYTGPERADLYLPATLGGYPLTVIGDAVFRNMDGLTGRLILPETVVSIGSSAFENCSGLTSLPLPARIVEIGQSAFRNCENLTGDLIMPNTLRRIGAYAFSGCTRMGYDFILSENLEEIGEYAFEDCVGFIDWLIFPETIKKIGAYAFNNCEYLYGKFTFDGDRLDIHEFAFLGSAISVLDTSDYLYSVADGVATITGYQGHPDADLHIPAEIGGYPVKRIGRSAFSNRSDLTGGIYLPDGLEVIETYAFHDSEFSYLHNLPDSIHTIERGAFQDCSSMTGSLYLPASLTRVEESVFEYCDDLTGKLVIHDGIEYIGPGAFSGCDGLTHIVFGDNVSFIDEYAFAYCEGLTGTLTLPSKLKTIESSTFAECYGLTGLVLPDGLENIGSFAFENCTGLTGQLILPDSITEISFGAFANTGFTGRLLLPAHLEEIGRSVFENCSGFTGELVIPDATIDIDSNAFSGCSGFTSLKLGSRLWSIGSYAFNNCTGLKGRIALPANMWDLADYAFAGCSGLTGTVILPDDMWFEENSFEGTGLTGIWASELEECFTYSVSAGKATITGYTGPTDIGLYIPAERGGYSVTAIAANAFSGKSAIEGPLVLPDGIVSIGDRAFQNCSGLTGTLTLPDELEKIGVRAFAGCTGFSGGVLIPSSVYQVSEDSFASTNVILTYTELVRLKVTAPKLTMNDGETLQLTVVPTPSSANAQVNWLSSDESIATVSANGMVTPLQPGTVTFTAVSKVRPVIKGSITIKIDDGRTYRALSVVILNRNTDSYRPHGERERFHIPNMLAPMYATPYQVTSCNEATKDQMLAAIAETFKNATSKDVSLLFFSGHGNQYGLGCENDTFLYFTELRQALDRIPGKKIVLIQACHSGSVILRGEKALQQELEAFNNEVIAAFAAQPRSGELLANDYYVLTSSHADEVSWGTSNYWYGYGFGVFTYGLCYGSGYDAKYESYISGLPADRNADNLITLDEAYRYAHTAVLEYVAENDHIQNVQVYPSNSSFVLWGK